MGKLKTMAKEEQDNGNNRYINIFGVIIPSLPSLMIRFGGLFLRFKREAKKGGRIFQRELINQGIDKKTAMELTEVYLQGSNLLQLVRNLQ